MRKLLFKKLLLMTLLAPYFLAAANNHDRQTYTKTITRAFPASFNGTTKIKTRYARVEINIWDKPTIQFKTQIEVEASSEADAQIAFKQLLINERKVGEWVSSMTMIKPDAQLFCTKNIDYKILKQVFLPAHQFVEFQLFRSHLVLPELSQRVTIDMDYGMLEGTSLSGKNLVRLNFVECKIGEVDSLVGSFMQSTCYIDKANYLEIRSVRSDFVIQESKELRCKTKFDDYRVKSIQTFINNGEYDVLGLDQILYGRIRAKCSKVDIKQVKHTIDVDMVEGRFSLHELLPEFSHAQFAGHKTNFEVALNESTSYQLQGNAVYAGIKYPATMAILQESCGSKEHNLQGVYGEDQGASPIVVKLNYGGIHFREKK